MKYIKKIFKVLLIVLILFLLRYLLYKYNIIEVNKIKYNNSSLNIPIKSDIVLEHWVQHSKVKVYFINKSFVSLYKEVNISYLLKQLNPLKNPTSPLSIK